MNRLEESYKKQKAIFDKAKSKKTANILKQTEEIKQKIDKLTKHYNDLTIVYNAKKKEEFIPYSQYVATATVQSSISKDLETPDLSHLDEETKALVLEELAKRNL